MIRNDEEYKTARHYVRRLQGVLLDLRRTHPPSQYDIESRKFLLEIAHAQREIRRYLMAREEEARRAA